VNGEALSLIVHSGSKIGKSTLANTTPTPRLFLDAEAAYRHLPDAPGMRKIFWDPMTEPIPTLGQGRIDPVLGSQVWSVDWDTCVVILRDYSTTYRTWEILNQYPHPFVSLSVDSISELQEKCKDQLRNLHLGERMTTQLWGDLLDSMKDLARKFRDLTVHPYYPLQSVIITSQTEFKDGKWRPFVQGKFSVSVPYYFDMIGYLYPETIPTEDPMRPSIDIRRMLITPHPYIEAGHRLHRQLGDYIPNFGFVITNPTVMEMINTAFGPGQERLAA
jgi:AAA domain